MKQSYLARVYSMHPLGMVAGICLIAVTFCACRWMWMRANEPSIQQTVRQVVHEEVVPLVKPAVDAIAATPQVITDLIDRKTTELTHTVTLQGDRLQANLETLRDQVTGPEGQVSALRAEVMEDVGNVKDAALDAISTAKLKLSPTLDNVAGITSKVDAALPPVTKAVAEELPPALRDLRIFSARLGRTAGHAEQMMGAVEKTAKTIDAAVPEALAKFEQAEDASVRTTEQTAVLMANLAEATKPLPKWARWTFGIGAQVAPFAAGIVATAAAAGVFAH